MHGIIEFWENLLDTVQLAKKFLRSWLSQCRVPEICLLQLNCNVRSFYIFLFFSCLYRGHIGCQCISITWFFCLWRINSLHCFNTLIVLFCQIFYALVDQTLFGEQPLPHGDISSVVAELKREHTNYGHVKGTHWETRFSHLLNYGAGVSKVLIFLKFLVLVMFSILKSQ